MKVFFTTKQHYFLKNHPQEDFFLLSKKYPIFAVADGVTLNLSSKDYPAESGAFEVAKIFCQTVVLEAEKRYENFKEKDLKEIFELGNTAVWKYNVSQGRTQKTINYYNKDLFSATASFAVIKNKKVFWFSLCDSSVSVFNNKGKEVFTSPDGWAHFPKNWKNGANEREKIVEMHKDYRNAVDSAGKLLGYGVIDGEESAELYLTSGTLKIKQGDLFFLYTDGFENYFKLKKFIDIFKQWPSALAFELSTLVADRSKKYPKKYSEEKTLIAVSI